MQAMRKLSLFLASSGLALLLIAAPALSAVLPVTGSVSLVIATLPPPTINGSGSGDTNAPGGAFSIPAGFFSGNPKIVVPISPTFVGLTNVTVPANSINNPVGSFTAAGGTMGLSGAAFFNNGAGGNIPLAPVGGGGTAMAVIQSIPVKLVGGIWQYSANKVFTAMGAALANAISATATAYDNRDGSGVGTVQLVATGFALVGPLGSLGNLPVFGVLTLTYTPEPGTLLLLGTGIAGLAVIGRKKLAR
jgi:hypothetical protein